MFQHLNQNSVRVAEFIVLVLFIGFGVYINANQVPGLRSDVGALNVRVSVVESRLGYIQGSLDRIEKAVKP